jgi:hypothetical protein|eukprot:scaffold493_cov258-Chaetoceros_neogracile.AAC.11
MSSKLVIYEFKTSIKISQLIVVSLVQHNLTLSDHCSGEYYTMYIISAVELEVRNTMSDDNSKDNYEVGIVLH